MARVTRIEVSLSENDVTRIVDLGGKLDMKKSGVATMAMRIGLDAMEMAFDPNMKSLMVKANKSIDQVLKDEQKTEKKPPVNGKLRIPKARKLAT
jgi:hypothetical protein